MSHAAPSTATLCMAMNEQQTIRAIFAGGHTVAGAQPIEVLAAMLDLARYQASLAADAPLSR